VFIFHSNVSDKWIKYLHNKAETHSKHFSCSWTLNCSLADKQFSNVNAHSFSVASCIIAQYAHAFRRHIL
jgi:hypothetical protein